MEYESVICFETHVELKTRSKLFCDCPVDYEASPNSLTCPVCTGQPGALPVLNKTAVEYSIRAGLALNCSINRISRFARKNYFYPDLPKGYQISQYEKPFCENGFLEITGDDGQPYSVGLKRIHLEEDAGKLVHSSKSLGDSDYSLVDYNRSSVPLLEIVTDHEHNHMRSIHEARSYLEKLRQILKYIDISDCTIEKGQFRCDVNISLRPKGSKEFGNRAEIKNMASFRFITDALNYEIKRQTDLLRSGKQIPQETRLFDESKGTTFPMRSKEDAPDYRYFPDPDLLEVEIDDDFTQDVLKTIPELPDMKVQRIIEDYKISRNDALVLTKDKNVSDYFEACAALCKDKKKVSGWITKDLFRLLNDSSVPMEQCPVSPEDFSGLVNLASSGEITDQVGRQVLEEMFQSGESPEAIIDKKGLRTIQDTGELEKIIGAILSENIDAVNQIMDGDKKPIGFLIGQAMKKTKGKADPKTIKSLLEQKLL